jgi:hypothetical protein
MADQNVRAEVIAALVTDHYSGFKDGDERLLEAASDVRLDEFRAASDVRRNAESVHNRLETDYRNVSARLKVSEERIKTLEQPLSEEDFMQKAPPSIKTLLEAKKAEEDAIRASLVSQLKDLGAHTEDELKKKSVDELRTLASYARVQVPDFSGRGLPVERNAQENNRQNYAPPDPYAEALKALRANTAKTH